jgi:DNA-directed RNA polymerase III subunit RPC5
MKFRSYHIFAPAKAREESPHGCATMSDAMDVDVDEVVREIDVYLSPALSQQTYLIQYPGQPESDGSSNTSGSVVNPLCVPVSARIKPRHGLVSAEHAVAAPSAPSYYGLPSQPLLRTFESQTIPVTTHLCLGKLIPDPNLAGDSRDALHLIPLSHITQMRPSFGQLGDDGVNDTPDQSGADQQQQQPIGFTRKESDRAAAARKNSYAYKKASQEAEAWIDLTVATTASTASSHATLEAEVFGLETPQAGGDTNHYSVCEKIACPTPQEVIWAEAPHQNETAPDDPAVQYIQTLNYIATGAHGSVAGEGSASQSKTLVANLTTLLQQTGGPVPFSILQGQLVGSHGVGRVPDEALLNALNVCAVLVRGNWCLHSKFLNISPSSISGPGRKLVVPEAPVKLAELQRLRTFLLLLLQDESSIDRVRLLRVYSDEADSDNPAADSLYFTTTPQRILAMLKLVARKNARSDGTDRPRSGWVLKIDDDNGFLQRYLDIVALHESYWDRQRGRFARELEIYRR